MFDYDNPDNPDANDEREPLSTDDRMTRGRLRYHGNVSVLAVAMGGAGEAQAWRPGMPPSSFPCPLCSGEATATAHPTAVGSITLACNKRCAASDLRTACAQRARDVFVWREDLIPEFTDEMIGVLEARFRHGALDSSSHAILGGGDQAKLALTVIGKLGAGADRLNMTRVRNQYGGVVALLPRADFLSRNPPSKDMRPFHVTRTIEGRLEVRLGLFDQEYPLVGRDLLASHPDRQVLVLEGEKARAGAEEMFPALVCVNSLCGAENARLSDWSPLADRSVTVLGDNDEAGALYARSVAAHALAAGALEVRIAPPPPSAPHKWDPGDGLPPGMTLAELESHLRAAPVVSWAEVKNALRVERDVRHWPPFRLPDGHLARHKHVVEGIEKALEHLDPGCTKKRWLAALSCLHHALGVDGVGIAVAWSRRDNDKHGKFRSGEVERYFERFEVAPHPTPMSVQALFWRARAESKARSNSGEDGWKPEPGAESEAALAAFESAHRKFRQGDNIKIGKQTLGCDGYEIEYLSEEVVKSEQKSFRAPGFDPKKPPVSIFTLWENNQRIKPKRLVFRPGEEVGPDEFNQFQGFVVKARKGAGSFVLYRELINRISRENAVTDDYLWKLLAYRMQNLDTFVPVCVVLIGRQGAFKSTVTQVMRKLLEPYSVTVSGADNLVGNFNGILHDKLFVQVEEVELTTEDQNNRLKNYITNEVIDYANKHQRQWRGENRAFIMMTSNARVPVRVPPDSRRFLLLKVSDPFDGDEAKRSDLYGRMQAELEAGGYESLMYALLHEDLAGFNPRRIPQTPQFNHLTGMDAEREPINSWWREQLERGGIVYSNGDVSAWSEQLPKDRLYRHYLAWCEENGPGVRNSALAKDVWARRLKDIVGGMEIAKRVRVPRGTREHVVELPGHETCCQVYERLFRSTVDRPESLAQSKRVQPLTGLATASPPPPAGWPAEWLQTKGLETADQPDHTHHPRFE